jgi:methylmalonyl-CoA mutase
MFAEFEKYLNESWKNAALQEVKGKSLEEVINWEIENMEIPAIYEQKDMESIQYLHTFHQSLFNPEKPQRNWRNSQKITVLVEKQANQLALEALNNGVTEVAFDLSKASSSINLDDLLKDIMLPYCSVSFWCYSTQAIDLAKEYVNYAKKANYELTTLSGSLILLDKENIHVNVFENVLKITENLSNFLVINILSSTQSIVLKYANMLSQSNSLISSLLEKGFGLKHIITKIQFSVFMSNQYFVEIAGLRALRMLFTEIVKEYGLKDYKPFQLQIQANTTINLDEKTVQESDWNMLSNTTQAMCAIIGGCDVLCVFPHNEGISDLSTFSYRTARNVHNLLAEESHLDKIIDAGAGSYYIEHLTDKIAEKIWEQFIKS